MDKKIIDFINYVLFFGGQKLGQELDDYFGHNIKKKQSIQPTKDIFKVFSEAFKEVEAEHMAADRKNKARYELAKKELLGVDSCLTKAESLIYDEDKYYEAVEIILVNIGYLYSITPRNDFEFGNSKIDYYAEIMDEIEKMEDWCINLLYTCADCAAEEWEELSRREELFRLYFNFATGPVISNYSQMKQDILKSCESLCHN